eukprot:gene8071-8902_t
MEYRGEDYDDKFVSNLVTFVASDHFQAMFEDFFVTYALEFTNESEHKLRYYELYQKFHDMFERQLESFCEEMKISQVEFMRKCKEATIQDPKARHYIDVLMSSVEYETFVKLMRLMRPVAAMRLTSDFADAKDVASTTSHGSSPSKGVKDREVEQAEQGDAKLAESKTESGSHHHDNKRNDDSFAK